MEEENLYVISKVQAGYNYMVYRNENNGKVFYKIGIDQTLPDGQKMRGYMPVRFSKYIDVPDKTKIKVKKAIENFYFAKNDTKHYNPIFYMQIVDFENVSEIVEAYQDTVNNMSEEDLPF